MVWCVELEVRVLRHNTDLFVHMKNTIMLEKPLALYQYSVLLTLEIAGRQMQQV